MICSIFFLAVIASRLRFSDIADKVRTAINLAKAYNVKEEALHDEQEITGKRINRLELLTVKVNEQLHQATHVLEQITPVMQYMQYFRNAGILVFLIILISSSLFITSVLGWTFVVLVLATSFYFNRATINNQFKALFLNFRIQFVKKGYWLFMLAFFPQILGYVLRIFFQVRETDLLIALSDFLVALYISSWLILAAHVDEQFGEIEATQQDLSRHGRWRLVKNAMAVLILIYGVSMTFKQLHLKGADPMMLVSISLLAWLVYFVGYYLAKVRWLGIIIGNVMAIGGIGILFKTLHLTGADQMLFIAFVAFSILIPLIIWKRKLFHHLLVRFCLAGFLISIYYSPVLSKLPHHLQLAYEHETINIDKEMKTMRQHKGEIFTEQGRASLDEGLKLSDWYLSTYGTRLGFTSVHRVMAETYWEFGYDALTLKEETNQIDSALLSLALEAAKQENKMLKLFNYQNLPQFIRDSSLPFKHIEMEANVLLAMGRKDEAIQALENIIQIASDEDLKKTLGEKIISIKLQL